MTLEYLKVLVAISAFLLIIQALRSIAVYGAVASLTKGPKRQLPIHVTFIALSYLIYVITTTVVMLSVDLVFYLDAIRVGVLGVNSLLGHYALYNVLSYDRRKLSKVTNFEDADDGDS